jgi:PAS domain S-box-containing protein
MPSDSTCDAATLHLLADSLPQLIWIYAADGVADYAGQGWQDYSGLSASRLLAMGWLEQSHPDDRISLVESWRRSVSSGEPLRLECRLRRHDGHYRWFDAQATPLKDALGQVMSWIISCSDIHETVELRQAALRSEQHLHSVFESVPVSITLEDWSVVLHEIQRLKSSGIEDFEDYFETHAEQVDQLLDSIRVIDVNQWTLHVFWAERKEQLVGRSLRWMFKSPSARAEFVAILIRLGRGGSSRLWEMQLCAFDGSDKRVLSTAVNWSSGSLAGVMLVSRVDVTDYQRVNKELHRQRVLLERISSLANVGGWVHDVATRTDSWTDEVSRIHGLALDAAVAADDFLAVFSAADRDLILNAFKQAISDARPFDLELPLLTARQERKWVHARGSPVVRNGKVLRVEGAIQDITSRKLAELEVQQLNASLERQVEERTAELDRARHDLQNILDALPTMIAYWDSDLRLRFFNKMYRQSVGVDAMYGIHFTEAMHKSMIEERLPRMLLALQGQVQRFEARALNRAGYHNFHSQTYYQPDIVDGVVRGVYVLIIDVTVLKQAEDGLRAANRELESFAYAVAHDLRAPLRAMSGFSSALLEDYASKMDAEAQGFAIEINKASRRMGQLLDGLLALSRSTQGEMRLDSVDMSAIAVTVLSELQTQDPDRRVRWQVQPGMIAFGDARMLDAVLRNLLGNAWKYTSRTADAEIRMDSIFRHGVRQFRVVDNGSGFDMAHADRLFKPFQRLHRQDEFAGIGIGLATVNRIVHRHGGEIYADASPGHGATFCFTLDEHAKSDES